MILRVARAISVVLNPVMILIFIPFLIVYRSTDSFPEATRWTVYTVIFLLLITIFILFMVRKRIFSDMDVSRREQRPLLYFVSIVTGFIYLLGLVLFHAPHDLFSTTIGIIIGMFIASLVNGWIKASIHVATISAFTLTIVILYPGFFPMLSLIPLLAWARIREKRHTLAEALVGGFLGGFLSLFVYTILKLFY